MNIDEIVRFSPNQETASVFVKGDTHIKLCDGNIVCSVSGGSDSDIVMDIVTKLDSEKKVKYVFFDTGIEYQATKDHLGFLEKKYGVEIQRVKAKTPVPVSCREHGVPFLSKFVSDMMGRLQMHNFQWEDEPFDVLVKRYPKCKGALKWWCNENGEKSRFNISADKMLKEFVIDNPPEFKISCKCCHYSKKLPAKQFDKENETELKILGVRKSENGIRSRVLGSCFASSLETRKGYDEWRPVFWFDDEKKQEYKEHNGVVYSDCYEVYGLKRTGCFACPFGSRFEEELQAIEKFEPKLGQAAQKIFGKSHDYTRKYREYKKVHGGKR